MKEKKINFPLVSVVIPTLNSSKFYRPFLRSLFKLSYPNVEFIFVDDGSTDGSYESMKRICAKDKRFIFIQNKKRLGIAGSRNIGISKSNGKYVAFLEVDMEVDKRWLIILVEKMERNKKLAGVTPLVLDYHRRDVIQAAGIRIIPQLGWVVCIGFGENKDKFIGEKYVSLGAVGSLVRKDFIEKIRGFDEKLFRNVEDIDFGWRIWIAGGNIEFVPSSVVYHWTAKPWYMRGNEVTRVDQEFHLSKNLRLIIKNFELKNVIKYLPQALFIMLIRIFINLLRGNLVPLLGGAKAFIWTLIYLPSTISERNHIQRQRKFSDSYLFGKLYEKGNFLQIYLGRIRKVFELSSSWHR